MIVNYGVKEKHKKQLAVYQAKSGAIELKTDATKETIWATQAQIADIFDIERTVATKHIRNIIAGKEVLTKSNVQKMHIANSDKPVAFYSLDVILAVGYRANSTRAIEFRKWVTKVLRQHITRGYTINRSMIAARYDEFMKVRKSQQKCWDFVMMNRISKLLNMNTNMMKRHRYNFLAVTLLAVFLWTPNVGFAHQPRLVESRQTAVPDPEVSKAYYGKLSGEPDVYVINASEAFDLYVNVLVPDIAGQKKDVSAVVLKDENEIALLDGTNFEWKRFFEPFGADTYWMGPEYKARAEAGTYEIRVWSGDNDSKYSLAIGEIEAFDGKEGFNALTIIPELKKKFFNESPIGFIASPFGWGLIVAMYLLAGIVGLLSRAMLKRFAKNSPRGAARNIGNADRLLRLAIGVGLLLWAATTTWSPILIFFSGFALFEAIFRWCGFYAALGKNTCPIQ